MRRISGRPQAETVMVLCRNDDAFHTCRFRDAGPLAAIQIRRIEHPGIFIAMSPFKVRECIWPEMAEHVIFKILPGILPEGRMRHFRCASRKDKRTESRKKDISYSHFSKLINFLATDGRSMHLGARTSDGAVNPVAAEFETTSIVPGNMIVGPIFSEDI